MADEQLEERLRELGSHLDAPEGERLAEGVAHRIREGRRARGPRLGPLVAATVAVAVLAGGAIALFGVPGVEIQRVPTPIATPPASEPALRELDLGRRVTLAEARRSVEINVLIPQVLGSPDEIFVDPEPSGGRVTLVYEPHAGLPEDRNTGVGMLVTMFRGSTEPDFVRKQVGPDTSVRPVTVEDSPGMWIEGAPHTVMYVDENGLVFDDSLRVSGNVLIWQEGGVTVRLESKLPLDRSLDVAGSMA